MEHDFTMTPFFRWKSRPRFRLITYPLFMFLFGYLSSFCSSVLVDFCCGPAPSAAEVARRQALPIGHPGKQDAVSDARRFMAMVVLFMAVFCGMLFAAEYEGEGILLGVLQGAISNYS